VERIKHNGFTVLALGRLRLGWFSYPFVACPSVGWCWAKLFAAFAYSRGMGSEWVTVWQVRFMWAGAAFIVKRVPYERPPAGAVLKSC